MAFFSTLSAIGGLLAGASAAAGSVLMGLGSAAATAASAVAGGTLSAASAIASGVINAGQLVLGEIISAPDLLASIASEGGDLISTGTQLITQGAATPVEVAKSVVAAGGDAVGLMKNVAYEAAKYAEGMGTGAAQTFDEYYASLPDAANISKEMAKGIWESPAVAAGREAISAVASIKPTELVQSLAEAGGDAAKLGKELISSGSMDVQEVAGAIQGGGGSAAKFLGSQIQNGAISAKDAMTYATNAGLDAGSFAKGLVESGLGSAQDLLTGSEGESWYKTVSNSLPSLQTIGNVASQVVSAPLDAAAAIANQIPGVASTAKNIATQATAAGGGTGLGDNALLNIASTLLQGRQAKEAAETQAAGTNRALDILEKNMATTREDLMQVRETGRADITSGFSGAESALSPFTKTNYLNMANQYLTNPTAAITGPGALPGAAWELEQGRKALEAGATRTSGGGLSGQQLKEASQYAINFASTKTDEALARLSPFLEMQYGAATNLANIRKEKGTTLANLGVQTVPQTAGQAKNIAATFQNLGDIESQKDISKGITIGNIAEYLR